MILMFFIFMFAVIEPIYVGFGYKILVEIITAFKMCFEADCCYLPLFADSNVFNQWQDSTK